MTRRRDLEEGSSPHVGRSRLPGIVAASLAVLVLGWIVLLAWLVSSGPGDHPVRDVYLYLALMYGGSALVIARGFHGGADRRAWYLLGAAQAFSTTGDLAYMVIDAIGVGDVFPSIADVFYLAYFPFAIAAVIVVVRRRARGVPGLVWLDALMLALASGGLIGALLLAPLDGSFSGGLLAIVVGGAYPVGDTVVMLLAAVGIAIVGVRRSGALILIAASMMASAVADLVYWNLAASDAYVEGTWLDALWPLSAILIAAAVWLPARPWVGGATEARGLLIVPAATLVIATATLIVGDFRTIPTVTVIAAVAAMGGVLNRLNATVRHTIQMIEARRDATTDELTHLLNRRGFTEEVERALRTRSGRDVAALLLTDLDGFKEINDSLGHPAGDQVLRAVATRLAPAVADAGAQMGRLGGDEFGVLMPHATADEALRLADRLHAALEERFEVAETTVSVGLSVGIAVAPDDGREMSPLLRRADIAMYRAKNQRLGSAVFDPAVDFAGEHRLQNVAELRQGIEAGELVLHFQPKITLATAAVEGVEALVRWERPGVGTVAPHDFLPLASRAGLMGEVTSAVLQAAASQARRWRADGIDLPIAVNIPAEAFSDESLPEEVRHLLVSHRLPGSALQVEITEQALLQDRARAQRVLKRLREMGIRTSIDDYGTGYSSLVYLRELDVDEVKIDRSFVLPLLDDERSASIVRSTIELVHSLGMRVVAEGIEERCVAQMLSVLGCDTAQGFHWTRALPAKEFEGWFVTFGMSALTRAARAAGHDTVHGPDAELSPPVR